MRNKFDEQLEELNAQLIQMGQLCEKAIFTAMKAMFDNDSTLLPDVFEYDGQIDIKERDIESLCMKLLLQQQPVATDLRVVSSSLKMISDMERIGDQASDIAELISYIGDNESTSKVHIRDMAFSTIKMVTDSVQSFVKKDLSLAKRVIQYDDTVDALFAEVKNELIALVSSDSSNGEFCLDLLMIAKYLERIGDHAVNIAQWVEYSITGTYEEG